jgi:hypothetical protein
VRWAYNCGSADMSNFRTDREPLLSARAEQGGNEAVAAPTLQGKELEWKRLAMFPSIEK